MLLSEMVRRIKDEEQLVNDTASASTTKGLSTAGTGSTEYTTNSVTYVLIWSYTITPQSGHRGYIRSVGWTMRTTGGTVYCKVTVQEGSGSEVTVAEKSTTSTSDVQFTEILRQFYGVDNSLTVRFYLRVSNNAWTGTIRFMEVKYRNDIGPNGFETLKTYTLNLSSESFLIYSVNTSFSDAIIKIMCGTIQVDGGCYYPASPPQSLEYRGILKVPSGSTTISIVVLNLFTAITVSAVKIGKIAFSDLQGILLTQYSSALAFTPPDRKTCIGKIKTATLVIHVTAYTSDAVTSISSGTNYIQVLLDGAEASYHRKADGFRDQYATATIIVPISAGSQHTISITKSNADTVVYIVYAFCPWILGLSEQQPTQLDFPQGSTLYLTLEPFWGNPTKTVKLGKKRAFSFGDATDYYSTASGTDILAWNYTFETVEVGQAVLLVGGYGGCISIIGVDVR